MTPITSKVCIVGDFAVGKTSVAERFVNNQFSEKYLTTVGVKIDTKEIERPDLGIVHKLVIWDVAGSDRFDEVQFAYLRGAAGLIYVADGTRTDTLRSIVYLREQIGEYFHALPCVALVNKYDLKSDWKADDDHEQTLQETFGSVYRTSAKTGRDVEEAILDLGQAILDGYLNET